MSKPITRPHMPMGQPPKDPVKRAEYDAKKQAAVVGQVWSEAQPERDRDTVVKHAEAQFSTLAKLIIGATQGKIRFVMCISAPGIGKTHTISEVMKTHKGGRLTAVNGYCTAIMLHQLLWENREKGDIIVLDDADGTLDDENALNLMKAATDTTAVRTVTYASKSKMRADEDLEEDSELGEAPDTFIYEGSIIMFTNKDYKAIVKQNKGKAAAHLGALISRAFVLQMGLMDKRELGFWVEHMMRERHMLREHGVSDETAEEILEWVTENSGQLSEMSLRVPVKCCSLVSIDPDGWKVLAGDLLK